MVVDCEYLQKYTALYRLSSVVLSRDSVKADRRGADESCPNLALNLGLDLDDP